MKKRLAIISLVLFLFLLPVTSYGAVFYDLQGYNWAQDSITRLADKGIINGTYPNYYSPGEYVTRGQVCALIGRIFEICGVGLPAFSDVNETEYYKDSIAGLRAIGILSGDYNGYFYPEAPASRETTMRIAGFMLIRGGFFEAVDENVLLAYPDGNQVLPENREYVSALLAGGFIKGDDLGMLSPASYLTRAEAAVILDRIYTFLHS
ncbi:MAG: S-layer homology domain-containing protein [Clostridia bacterium]|nr:S-layer homology domain-containing protein [Clostridia bacterium]